MSGAMMWLIGQAIRSPVTPIDEAHSWKEEAEELRFKLDALRMAEYREAQRRACGLENTHACESQAGTAPPREKLIPTPLGQRSLPKLSSLSSQRDCKEGDDLEAMYDFSKFLPSTSQSKLDGVCLSVAVDTARRCEGDNEDAKATTEVEHLRVAEAALREKRDNLECQLAEQTKKLSGASSLCRKARSQLRQLIGHLHTLAPDDLRPLAEKGQHLEAMLDDAASVLEDSAPHAIPTRPGEDELHALAAITSELADELEKTKDSEQSICRQLEVIRARREQERERRLTFESELGATAQEHDARIAELRLQLLQLEQSLAWEQKHVEELEKCPRKLDMKLDVIKKN
jgi:septal ring factor EnvC (AmiA/AmiB activator)